VYVDLDGRCVGVVGLAAVAVPCALRVPTPDLGPLTGDSASVRAGALHLDGVPLQVFRLQVFRLQVFRLQVTRLVDVRVPRLSSRQLARLGERLESVETAESVEAADPLVAAIGSGPGLTPEADDELCGWLAIHRAAGIPTPSLDAAVLASLHRTTLLSGTLLECAVQGEVVPEFAAYVAALGSPAEDLAAARLAGLGHTSGEALLRGARRALAHLMADPSEVARADIRTV
jgi:hypothetical protein